MSNLQLSLFPAEPHCPPHADGPVVADFPRSIPAAGIELVASVLGSAVACRIRRSPRARRASLLVDRGAILTVVLPPRFPLREVPALLEEHARWIVRTIERHRGRAGARRAPLVDGGEIQLLGVRHVVRFLEGVHLAERPRVWKRGSEILVRVPPLDSRTCSELLKKWLRAEAASGIRRRVRALNGALGFRLGRISVRDQKTKWGACSGSGDLSFNWRLAMAPLEVLDYVILHELCHLRELNHSRRFWALLRCLSPDFERHRAWLREHAEALEI